jgi:hypothetical protein
MHASGADMHKVPQLGLPLTGIEQGSGTLYVCPVIQCCGNARMIEPSRTVVDRRYAINCPPHLLYICDISNNDRYRIAKSLACLFLITHEYAQGGGDRRMAGPGLALFLNEPAYQCAPQKAACSCH